MDYTFIQQYSDGALKRRRLAKACDTCRTRKKRCVHFAEDPDEERVVGRRRRVASEPTSEIVTREEGAAASDDRNAENDDDDGPRATSSSSATAVTTPQHFVSDLRPHARLLAGNPTDAMSRRVKSTDNIGVWVDKKEWDALIRARDRITGAGASNTETPASNAWLLGMSTTRPAQYHALIDIYFERIHPFLPLLEEHDFRTCLDKGSVSEPLIQAMCLVAAKEKSAEAHLTNGEDVPVSTRELCSGLHSAVKGALTSAGRHDKLTLIRILALLSLHNEGSDGPEEASLFLAQAMHYSQTLQLHLGQQASLPAKDSKPMKLLFWSLWTLDRLNAATNGRPIIMADNDIAIEPFSPRESGFPAFEILLKIAGVFNEVIGFYRPGNPPDTTGWEDGFPGFEEVVEEFHGWQLSTGILSTLHIAYLVTAIVSHRSKSIKNRGITTPSYVRQSLAVIQIIRLMAPDRIHGLHAFPILPYAISLALSVSYQRLRQDRLKHQQEDARADFESCCKILLELRRKWANADLMAALAQKVLDEVRREPDLSNFRIQRSGKNYQVLERLTSACRPAGEALVANGSTDEAQSLHDLGDRPIVQSGTNATLEDAGSNVTNGANLIPSQGLFEGMDDIFGTYLDPNYPVNFDGLSFLDEFQPEWTTGVT